MTTRLPNHTELSWAIRAIQDFTLCAGQHHLLFTILSCTNKKFEISYSYQELANITRLDRSTVLRKMKLLVKKGYITLLEKGNVRTMTPNKFRLNANKILANIESSLYKKIMKDRHKEDPTLVAQDHQPLVAQDPEPSGTVPPKAYTISDKGKTSQKQSITPKSKSNTPSLPDGNRVCPNQEQNPDQKPDPDMDPKVLAMIAELRRRQEEQKLNG